MSDWTSFFNKKGISTGSKQAEGPVTTVMALLDKINCSDLLTSARGVTGDLLFLALLRDFRDDTQGVLQFAFHTTEDFADNPKLAFLIIKNKGIIPTRKSFFLECGLSLRATTPNELISQLRNLADQRGFEYKIVSEDTYDVMKCGEAFIDRDYAACAKVGGPDFAHLRHPSAILLALVALQRLHREDEATRLAAKIQQTHASNTWLQALTKLATGQIELPQVLGLARADDERYQAHFYAGARLNTLGRITAARTEFAHCLSTPAQGIESHLVELEIAEPPA